jgi:hypothetical protein
VRWVYKKEHSDFCGIESVCYDKNNRAIKCLGETYEEEQKNKVVKNKKGVNTFKPPVQNTKPVSISESGKVQVNFDDIMNAENENEEQKNISGAIQELILEDQKALELENILNVENTDGLPVENIDEGIRYIDRESFTLDFKNKNFLEKVLQNIFDFKLSQNFIFIE